MRGVQGAHYCQIVRRSTGRTAVGRPLPGFQDDPEHANGQPACGFLISSPLFLATVNIYYVIGCPNLSQLSILVIWNQCYLQTTLTQMFVK